jgi:hypothetical protein
MMFDEVISFSAIQCIDVAVVLFHVAVGINVVSNQEAVWHFLLLWQGGSINLNLKPLSTCFIGLDFRISQVPPNRT